MPNATKATLRTEIQKRADLKTVGASTWITTTELDGWIDDAHRELYALVSRAHPDTYLSSETKTLTSTGIYSFTVTDVLKVYGVDAWPGESREYEVPRFNWHERRSLTSLRDRLSYRDRGSSLTFEPAARANGVIVRVWYVPQPTMLTSGGSDTLDNVMDQWREFIVTECAAKVREADQDVTSATVLRNRKAELEAKLIAMAPKEEGQPEQVAMMFAPARSVWD